MLFNSYEFIFLFLPITLLIFYAFCRFGMVRSAVWWVGIVSLFFYAYWDWRFLFLFVGSIIFNYFVGTFIIKSENFKIKKFLLFFGLLANLGLLGFFKYSKFFMQNLMNVTGASLTIPEVILPIGISFLTFTQIAYLVDCMRGCSHKYRFFDYLLFVSFFPHLVAGPILRHNAIIPQLESKAFGRPSSRKIYMAIVFFSIGLFKKVIIADNIALYVDPLFQNSDKLTILDAWAAALLYTFQIYFDFSAYSEMAIGLALLMNVRIPINFNSPYKAKSIVDFWRRWHISLSTFLRDYLYIPLGGNRKGPLRLYISLFATMLLGGLWHGAGWTFIIWGGLHGMYLTINHAWRKVGVKLPHFLSWTVTFLAVIVAWVFFRAQTLSEALSLLKKMAGFSLSTMSGPQNYFLHLASPFFIMTSLMLLVSWTLMAPNTQQMATTLRPQKRVSILIALMLMIGILGLGKNDNFIYFQF